MQLRVLSQICRVSVKILLIFHLPSCFNVCSHPAIALKPVHTFYRQGQSFCLLHLYRGTPGTCNSARSVKPPPLSGTTLGPDLFSTRAVAPASCGVVPPLLSNYTTSSIYASPLHDFRYLHSELCTRPSHIPRMV